MKNRLVFLILSILLITFIYFLAIKDIRLATPPTPRVDLGQPAPQTTVLDNVQPLHDLLGIKEPAHADQPVALNLAPIATPEPTPEPTALPTPQPTPEPTAIPTPPPVSGNCSAYAGLVSQYPWNVSVALAVMYAESRCNPSTVNNNPSTGDYSIGLFQINLYGRNAYNRPSEAELKDPEVNIAWAYKIFAANGSSFIGQWGVCRTAVACY